MTLVETLEAKKSELAEVKSAVEAGDTEQAEKMAALIGEVKSVQTAIEEAEEAENMLKSLSNNEVKEVEPVENYKSLGEFAEKNLDFTDMINGKSRSAGAAGFKAYTDAETAPQIITYSQDIRDGREMPSVRDLLGAEAISGNALTFYQLGSTEGAPTEVSENGAKPQIHIPYTPVTVPLTKVAAWFYETDELLSDAPFLRSAIDNRGLREVAKKADAVILDEIADEATAYAGSYQDMADQIFDAAMAIQEACGYAADGVVINPADYGALRLNKDGASQYYGGGYFTGAYGNGSMIEQPPIWGMRTIVTNAIPQGTVIVGAWRDGATVVTKAGEGIAIEVHRGDHDDAIYNRVTVVVEERLAVAVRIPGAFQIIGGASS